MAIGAPDRPLVTGPEKVFDYDAGSPTFYITDYDPTLNCAFTASPQLQLRPFRSGGIIYSLTRSTGTGYVTVTASNGCGPSLSTQFDFTVTACTGYTVYPNPADE